MNTINKGLKESFVSLARGLIIGIVASLTIIGGTEFANYVRQDSGTKQATALQLYDLGLREAIRQSEVERQAGRYSSSLAKSAHAGAFTDFAENKLIDFIFRGQASGLPSTWFVALYTACPTDSTAGTEVTNANAYARVSVGANALTNWAGTQSAGSTVASTGTNATTSNNSVITFPTVTTSSWGTINCYGLVDSGTYGAGNLWVYSTITVPPTLTVGSTASFAAGALTVQIDN